MIGPVGPPGKDAFNLIQWTPHSVRRMFRESEIINIFFDTKTDGIIFKNKKPVGLKNRGIGPPVVMIENFPKLTQIKHAKYMMELNNSLFKVNPVKTGTTSPSLVIFALSFKALSNSTLPRFLFSNENITRAISIKEGDEVGILKIHSSGIEKEVEFDYTEWAVLLVQYRCVDHIVYCQYNLNDESGSLEPKKQDEKDSDSLYIGGHPNKNRAHHAVGSFEVYYSENGDEFLSDEMSKCLMSDILDRVGE